MKYIIMCGGKYGGWDKPRQLTEICGEPIVARTIRLLSEQGIQKEDIFISSNYDDFGGFGVVLLKHENEYGESKSGTISRWLDAFYPANYPVCYLYGDVFYSPEAIKTIVETDTDSIEFFASKPPYGPGYIKHWEEPFAFKVKDYDLFRHCIEVTKHYGYIGKFSKYRTDPISWELWQVIKGTALDVVEYNYTVINDYTCDVDSMEDAEKIGEYIRCNYQS